jgi:DNA-binding NarL/FixJ family response regulator
MNEHGPSRRLTDSHEQVLLFLSKGLRNAEIAHQLGLTERSIKGYVSQLLLIFDVTNRTELVGLFTSELLEARQNSARLKSANVSVT